MSSELYSLFLFTTLMLIIVPGPSAITAAKQGAANNKWLTFLCVFGIACGDAIFFLLSATGLASLIVASSGLFQMIKWLGIGYLLFLGVSAFFARAEPLPKTLQTQKHSSLKAFSNGLSIQLANPKALMYFSALLPQFINPNQPILGQLLLMGASCVIADIIVYSFFGLVAGKLSQRPIKPFTIKLINKVAGTTLLATAVRLITLKATP